MALPSHKPNDAQLDMMTNPNLSQRAILAAMLEQNAAHHGAGAALCRGGKEPLSHRELRDQVAAMVPVLNHLGVGRNDRVAIVLPQGPELAAAFLAVAAGATAAPLNPAYVENEFRFYLQDLQAQALMLPQGSGSRARAAADAIGLPFHGSLISETHAPTFAQRFTRGLHEAETAAGRPPPAPIK